MQESAFTSFGGGPIGFAYGKFQTTGLYNDVNGTLSAQTLHLSQFGGTILQSMTKGLILGTTLKLMRGYSTSAPVTNLDVNEALKAGADLDGDSVNKFDYDIGIMMQAPKVRIGVTLKNMQQPSFPSSAGTAIELKRHGRIGLAVIPTTGLTLAMDLDLDKADTLNGLRRMIAFGGESKLGSHVLVRGGVRWSLDGERRRVGTAGFSYQLKKGFWLDSQYTQGDYGGDRGYEASRCAQACNTAFGHVPGRPWPYDSENFSCGRSALRARSCKRRWVTSARTAAAWGRASSSWGSSAMTTSARS